MQFFVSSRPLSGCALENAVDQHIYYCTASMEREDGTAKKVSLCGYILPGPGFPVRIHPWFVTFDCRSTFPAVAACPVTSVELIPHQEQKIQGYFSTRATPLPPLGQQA